LKDCTPGSNVTMLVNQALLTVTANNASRAYATANPSFTAGYSGFVNGDTVSALSGHPHSLRRQYDSQSVNRSATVSRVGGGFPCLSQQTVHDSTHITAPCQTLYEAQADATETDPSTVVRFGYGRTGQRRAAFNIRLVRRSP